MDTPKPLNRREFISTAAATAATFTIVPSHVIAGTRGTPPSEQIALAQVGCGTQGLVEMNYMLKDDRIRLIAVCDPNKFSTDYIDWNMNRINDRVRQTLEDDSWGRDVAGIQGGRDVAKAYADRYYGKFKRSGNYKGCVAYEDFREMFANHEGLDGVKIMTPDHLHGTISLQALDQGLHVATHKPIANRLQEGMRVVEKAAKTDAITHLLAWADIPQYQLILEWIEAGVIGELQEIHNWTARPVWQQWTERPGDSPPIPEGLNWDLWLGPVPDMPYHPNYTHNVFRGWYDFGGGSVADMGHYSLFPLFEAFGIDRAPTRVTGYGTRHRVAEGNLYRWLKGDVAFPPSAMIRWRFPEQATLPSFELFWYDGGKKPFPPEELERDGREMPDEGLLFVGSEGKIMSGFRGATPQIIPRDRMRKYAGRKSVRGGNDSYESYPWIDHFYNRTPSPGSFVRAKTVTETINLGAVALQTRGSIEYDAASQKITNNQEANLLLTRVYRPGWEIT